MKKFATVSAIIAVIMIVLGGTIFMAAGLCGGYRAVKKMVVDEELSWNLGDARIRLCEDGSLISMTIGNGERVRMDIPDMGGEGSEISYGAGDEETTSLYIEAGGGTIRFLESEDDKIHVEADTSDYEVYRENGTLYVRGADEGFTFSIGNGFLIDAKDLNVYLPAGKVFENVSLYFGGGEVELGNLKAENLSLSVGAAQITADYLEVTDTLQVELGAGEILIHDGVFHDVETEVGAGNIEVCGKIAGNLSADTAMGNTEFVLYGKEEDHNYNVDCAAGEVTVGRESFAGLAAERVIRNGADSTFDLSCAMGSLSVKFIGE